MRPEQLYPAFDHVAAELIESIAQQAFGGRQQARLLVRDVMDHDAHEVQELVVESRAVDRTVSGGKLAELGDQSAHLVVLGLALLERRVASKHLAQRGVEKLLLQLRMYIECEAGIGHQRTLLADGAVRLETVK